MQNSPYWRRVAYYNWKATQTEVLSQFLEQSSWEEVKKRPELFDVILDSDVMTAADQIQVSRNILIEKIFQNGSQVPLRSKTGLLTKFANFDFKKGADVFNQEVAIIFPNVGINPNLDLTNLQVEAKRIVNGLNNLGKITLLQSAEDLKVDVSVLKNHSPEKINDIWKRAKEIDSKLSASMKTKQPLDKQDVIELTNVLKDSGRINMEIQDLNNTDDRSAAIKILEKTVQSLAIVRRAQKDGRVEKLNTVEGIVEVLESIQEEDVKRFSQAASSKVGPMATETTPPTSPPAA